MKINRNDMDPVLLDKIDRFDNLLEQLSLEGSGFLTFDSGKFQLKKISDLNIRRTLNADNLDRYINNLYNEDKLVINSFRSNLNIENITSNNFTSLLVVPKEEVFYTSKSRILISKRKDGFLYFIDAEGTLVKYDLLDGRVILSINLGKEITTGFAVPKIAPYDFLALEPVEDKLLISTRYNGIFLYDFEKKTLEIKFPENDIVVLKVLTTGLVLCGADRIENNVIFYNLETGSKAETSNILQRQTLQIPHLVDEHKGHLFLVGSPLIENTTKNTVHYWKKDPAGIAYNSADGDLFPGHDFKKYELKHLELTDTHAYISGLKRSGELFVWQYNLNSLSDPFKEFSFDAFKFTDLPYVSLEEEHFIAADGRSLYYLNADGTVHRNFLLSENIRDVFFIDSKKRIIVLYDSKIVNIHLPAYTDEKIITLNVYKDIQPCNNINILVKGSTEKDKYTFIDGNEASVIIPFYMATYNGDTIIKLLGSTASNIIMKITPAPSTQIKGVVVHANQLFLK